jgi:hypothetical protein
MDEAASALVECRAVMEALACRGAPPLKGELTRLRHGVLRKWLGVKL